MTTEENEGTVPASMAVVVSQSRKFVDDLFGMIMTNDKQFTVDRLYVTRLAVTMGMLIDMVQMLSEEPDVEKAIERFKARLQRLADDPGA